MWRPSRVGQFLGVREGVREADCNRNRNRDRDRERERDGRLVSLRQLGLSLAIGLVASPEVFPSAREAQTVDTYARDAALAGARAYEATLRASPRGERSLALGSDPVAIERVDDGFVVLERRGEHGHPALVQLDHELRLVGEAAAECDGDVRDLARVGELLFVACEQGATLRAYEASTLARRPDAGVHIHGASGFRSLASVNGCLFALDETREELRSRCRGEAAFSVRATQRFPSFMAATPQAVLVASALDHSVEVHTLTDERRPPVRVVHDAPIYAANLVPSENGSVALLVTAGIEDRPLDRTGGTFGNIDSFLTVYALKDVAAEKIAEVNLSAAGVLTPKVVAFDPAHRALFITGFGSGVAVRVGNFEAPSALDVRPVASIPGIVDGFASGGAFVGVSTLFDRATRLRETKPPELGHARTSDPSIAALQLGEALLFTELMSPFQSSEGTLSRFTCEACHFEGWTDGRKHHTGRGDVHATTKPLFGLLDNAPLFTRALDPDVTTMVFAEFAVAARGTGHDGWFSGEDAELAWLSPAPFAELDLGPVALRDALLEYLAERPFPRAPREGLEWPARGAEVFAQRCESCHAARTNAMDADTRVPPSEWETALENGAAEIVWARAGYERTGIEPYVHEAGARPSSLRRISKKAPFFTNGSARTLEEVLRMARLTDTAFLHAGPDDADARRLSDEEQRELLRFLRSL